MAKEAKKVDTKAGKKAKVEEKAAAAPEFKYGVADIAEALDREPASIRVALRNKGIEKAGKSYGWNTKSELNEVIDQLKSTPAKKAKDEDDEKPKSKKADKKAAGKDKPAKKAKKAKDEDDDD